MKVAKFWEKRPNNKVKCTLCPHNCIIRDGRAGICGVRVNRGGILYTLVYDKIIAANVDPIEKKPLFHVLPGSSIFSIATVGCNMRCKNCQNYSISQYPILHNGEVTGDYVTPKMVVEAAIRYRCKSIAYTYTEPTIFYELAYDTAKIAHEKGLRNFFITNGYINRKPLKEVLPYLDGANIDLKSFRDATYRRVVTARLSPVLETIKFLHENGKWVEVTTLLIPGINDSEEELRDIARFIKGISPDIPWHISAFYPAYKMQHVPPTPPESIRRAREVGLEEGLKFVYSGNLWGDEGENTYCPGCGRVVIGRVGYKITELNIVDGKCKFCGTPIPGIFE